MDYWHVGPISIFLEKQMVSLIFVAIVYFLFNRYSMGLVSVFLQPLKKIKFKGQQIPEALSSSRPTSPLKQPALELFEIAEQYIRTGNYPEAIKELEMCVAIEPHCLNGEPWVKLSKCYLLEGKMEKVTPLLDKAVDWFPSTKTLCEAGILFQRAGNRLKAKEVFNEALRDYRITLSHRKRAEWYWAAQALIRNAVL